MPARVDPRRVIPVDDSGMVTRSPLRARRPNIRPATTAIVQARTTTPSPSPVQRAATQLSLLGALQSVISTGVRIANLAVRAFESQTAARIRLAANYKTRAADRFMYAQVEDEDAFEELYTLGLREYSSERAERRRLMAEMTGDDIGSPQLVSAAGRNLTYTNRRIAELSQGLNLLAQQTVVLPDLSSIYMTMNSQDREELLEAVLGYRIEFDEASTERARLQQLQNLAAGSLQIIDYINSVVSPEVGLNSVDIFTRFYTRSRPTVNSSRTPITVYLGADAIAGEYSGLTPMPVNNRDAPEELRRLYLGSQVSAGTIMHELTHQIDRYFDGQMAGNFATYLAEQTNNRFGITYPEVMLTRAARTNIELGSELFADFGMTAYGHIASGQFYVDSDNPNDIIGFNPNVSGSAEMSRAIDNYFAYIFSVGQLPR